MKKTEHSRRRAIKESNTVQTKMLTQLGLPISKPISFTKNMIQVVRPIICNQVRTSLDKAEVGMIVDVILKIKSTTSLESVSTITNLKPEFQANFKPSKRLQSSASRIEPLPLLTEKPPSHLLLQSLSTPLTATYLFPESKLPSAFNLTHLT
ncbi:hypothetical protein ACOSQ2_005278 [Xanthoceras sorbifolium]